MKSRKEMELDPSLSRQTKVHRYMSFESFVSFVESKQTYITNINEWDDEWEAILAKAPTVNDEGKRITSLYSFYQSIYGQSWSLFAESDALWRIYSPHKTGIVISTTIEKFELIQGIQKSFFGKVIYFDGVKDLMEKSKNRISPFGDALLKRSAFFHEQEVRLLTNSQFLEVPGLRFSKYINLSLDPFQFIDSITVDPRADEWIVNTIKNYCERAGFNIEPEKSSLYDPDPHLSLGIERQWVPVDKKEKSSLP